MTQKERPRGVGRTTEPRENSGQESYTRAPARGSADSDDAPVPAPGIAAATAPQHKGEAAARAAVASIAMNEAGKMSDPIEKRDRLELAQTQLLRSLRCLQADLDRLSA